MNDDDARIEAKLLRYRPVGPPAELRRRILQSGSRRRSPLRLAWWLSVAAMLVISVGLQAATDRVTGQTQAMLGAGRVRWTAEAEEMAQMLDGDEWARRYLALALAADANRVEPIPPGVAPTDVPGESQWTIR